MKIQSVPEAIIAYLKKKKRFVSGGEIERNLPVVNKPSYISRVLRLMAEDGELEKSYKKMLNKTYVVYKINRRVHKVR